YLPAYVELLLEYVYSQIVFTLTGKVQAIFRKSPSYDLRPMLGASASPVLLSLLDRGELSGAFLASGVEAVPLPPPLRAACTHALQSLGKHVPNLLLGALVSRGAGSHSLVTLVSPANREHQLDGPDLSLLTNYVSANSASLMSAESWFPVCLPRFNPAGFVHCYACCLSDPAELFLLLLSATNTPEQFHAFQNSRAAVVHALGLKQRTAGRIIHQHSFEDARGSSMRGLADPGEAGERGASAAAGGERRTSAAPQSFDTSAATGGGEE
ncbi:hypothetical protein TeGR_g14173, partial [Tetraparma gracilis]